MRSLTPAEYAVLLTIEADTAVTCNEASAEPVPPPDGPDFMDRADALRLRGLAAPHVCRGCTRDADDGTARHHWAITNLGRLALRLANATLSDLITA